MANISAYKCEYKKAIDYYQKSFNLEAKPRMIDALNGIEICYEIIGDIDKANITREKIIDVLKNDWGFEQGEVIDSVERRMK